MKIYLSASNVKRKITNTIVLYGVNFGGDSVLSLHSYGICIFAF